MSFLVVLRDRDDGDYDTVAAFQKDDDSLDAPAIEWAIQVIEYMREEHEGETFRVVESANVTDVIEKGVWSCGSLLVGYGARGAAAVGRMKEKGWLA